MHWDPSQLAESIILPVVIHLVLIYFAYQRLIWQARHAYDKHKQPAPRQDGAREPRASPSSKTKEPDIESSGPQPIPARHSELGGVSRTVETPSKRRPWNSAQKGTRKMSSAAKIGANRRNALASTGPKTASGKSHSRFNAVKHGIYATAPVLPGEDEHAYRELLRSYEEHFAPVGPVEAMLVREIATEQWRLYRIERAEFAVHVQLNKAHMVRFLHTLVPCELAYIESEHGNDLREEIAQQNAEAFESNLAARNDSYPVERTLPWVDPNDLPAKLTVGAMKDVERRLSCERDIGSTVLDSYGPDAEDAPQVCLDRERRTTLRVYLTCAEKLAELQQARLTWPLVAQSVATKKGQKLTNVKSTGASHPEEAANQNDKRSG